MCQNPTISSINPSRSITLNNQQQKIQYNKNNKSQIYTAYQQINSKQDNNNVNIQQKNITNNKNNDENIRNNSINQQQKVIQKSQQQSLNNNIGLYKQNRQQQQKNIKQKQITNLNNNQNQNKKQQIKKPENLSKNIVNKIEPINKQPQQINSQNRIFRSGDIIINPKKNIAYKAIQLIGTGTFGQVLSVITCSINPNNNINIHHRMALKIIKKQPAYINQGLIEIKNLRQIAKYQQKLQNDKKSYLKLYDGFMWEGYLCIAMELLDNSILNILEISNYKGLEMKWIQMWTKQILFSLAKIHKMGIIHCDIKPENIMFRPQEPQKPLLIDFSSSFSCYLKGSQIFTYIQSRFYRSPEVLMGLKPYTQKIDIWSLGCVLAQMYLGLPIFPGGSGFDQISKIYKLTKNSIQDIELNQMIKNSQFGQKYFYIQKRAQAQMSQNNQNKQQKQDKQQTSQFVSQRSRKINQIQNKQQKKSSKIRLKTYKQYKQQYLEKIKINEDYYNIQSLEEMIAIRNPSSKDIQTHQLFIDLIKKMLIFDPQERFTAEDAFLHPFVGGTFSQLADLRVIQDFLQEQYNLGKI